MSPKLTTVRVGLRRGWIEFRLTVTNVGEMLGWLWPSLLALLVMYALRDSTVPGTDFSLGAQSIPGILGMNIVLTGMMGLASTLITEREDGTLLRAKAIPNGVPGYLTGKVVSQSGMTAAVLLVVLLPAAFLFDGLELGEVSSWLRLSWVVVLGLVATLPLGALLGAVFHSPQGLGVIMLLLTGMVGISGVFYPITALPEWLQLLGQLFPVYWLGIGMRSALLPETMSAVEIGDSWRLWETLGVLGLWAVLGFALAPRVLGRMARRADGARLASASPAQPASS
ncbi:ABC transporter permease [Streptomyces oceani]|uniref:ABC transporter n=1 Tax=Streptomyces oceani TaxID=1075402 RepID=A0A1E7JTW8_9ACTN|nr:ABC transporter permease [Streptomyces oceani]OEU93412.1 ABC transporter [Streptomyces oceani]